MALFGNRLFSGLSRLVIQPVQGTFSILQQVREISLTAGLSNVRNHFPRPSEVKRITRHGWKARLSTQNGRKVLMRRILKGRHVLSH